jgi:hypothetical protein
VPPLGLRISAIFDLQPSVAVVFVNAEFALRHNSLEVAGANFREKALPVLFDVLRIKQAWALCGPDESCEALLSLDKGHLPQVLAIKPTYFWSPSPTERHFAADVVSPVQIPELESAFPVCQHELPLVSLGAWFSGVKACMSLL